MKLKWNSKKTEDSWRILKYNSEIVGGFEKLLKLEFEFMNSTIIE